MLQGALLVLLPPISNEPVHAIVGSITLTVIAQAQGKAKGAVETELRSIRAPGKVVLMQDIRNPYRSPSGPDPTRDANLWRLSATAVSPC